MVNGVEPIDMACPIPWAWECYVSSLLRLKDARQEDRPPSRG